MVAANTPDSPKPGVPAPKGSVPLRYHLVFGDDFDDPDVSRLDEDTTGGRASLAQPLPP
jgi:hypothetical protein